MAESGSPRDQMSVSEHCAHSKPDEQNGPPLNSRMRRKSGCVHRWEVGNGIPD